MGETAVFSLDDGALEATLPQSWCLLSEEPGCARLGMSADPEVIVSLTHRLFEVSTAVTDGDFPQFFDRDVLVPKSNIERLDADRYYSQYLNRAGGRSFYIDSLCRRVTENQVRRANLIFAAPEDWEVEEDVLEMIGDIARTMTLINEPARDHETPERLELRLVDPFYEVLFEVPWDWTHEWSEEMDLPLYYRDEDGTGTLQV